MSLSTVNGRQWCLLLKIILVTTGNSFFFVVGCLLSSNGHNATDETPRYEMPLIFVFGVLGFGWVLLCIGILGVGVLSRDPVVQLIETG